MLPSPSQPSLPSSISSLNPSNEHLLCKDHVLFLSFLEFPFPNNGQIDWDSFFDDLSEDGNAFYFEPSTNPSPDSVSLGIDEIENFLLKDDDDKNNSVVEEPSKELCDSFSANILLASPVEVDGEVVDASSPIDKDSSTDTDDGNGNSEKEKVNTDGQAEDEAHDSQSKKRRRY